LYPSELLVSVPGREQADVCHAYQLLSLHGVPDENIVVFIYDDIGEFEWKSGLVVLPTFLCEVSTVTK
jgi:hypothetical protein